MTTRSLWTISVMALALFAACADAGDPADDAEAEGATAEQGVTGAPTGLYATAASTTLKDGDIASVELRADGTFVRARCYHAGCALEVPESDHYDSYASSAGKTYLRFYGHDAAGAAAVADVYEVTRTSTTIKLRKSYTSRWVTLKKTTAKTACTHDGGAWSGTDCACPNAGGWSDDGYVVFAPGAGGCVTVAGVSEAECDDTHGAYTDDDATPIGTYCVCAIGEYLSNTGCAAL